jgi:ankyrin repeat protein
MISPSSITTSPGLISPKLNIYSKHNEYIAVIMTSSAQNMQRSLNHITKLANEKYPVDLPDDYGKTPLYYAARSSKVELAQKLIDMGANPNTQDLEGMSPCHIAACGSSLEMINLLFDNGGFLFGPDHSGDLPLHWAIRESRSPDIIKNIAKRDPCMILCKNFDGETPYDFAVEFGEMELVELFGSMIKEMVAGDDWVKQDPTAKRIVANHIELLQKNHSIEKAHFANSGIESLTASASLVQ